MCCEIIIYKMDPTLLFKDSLKKEEVMAKSIGSKSATFKLFAPSAKKVSVVGSFNKWDIKKNLAKKDTKGNWSTKLDLKPGKYEYKFFVDGNWWNDPNCNSCVANSFGSQNCIIEIK